MLEKIELVKEFMVKNNQITEDFKINFDNISNKDLKNIKLRFILYIEKLEELFEVVFEEEIIRNIKSFLKVIKNNIISLEASSLSLNKKEIARVITDIEYINIGSALLFNIPLDQCFSIIHKNNIEKSDNFTGKPILREDGKVLYDSSHTPPNLESVFTDTLS